MTGSTDVNNDPFCDLVISILAVNNYSLDKAFVLGEALCREGISNPDMLSKYSFDEIYTKLISSGYDRGEFLNSLFAERLLSLGDFIRNSGIATFLKIIESKDAKSIAAHLKQIKGVGPTVIRNFALLRDFRTQPKSSG